MPTTRRRYHVTETPAVAHALDAASRRWPGVARSKLLLRLVAAGHAALEADESVASRSQQEAVKASSGKYGDAFSADYLAQLRRDWPM